MVDLRLLRRPPVAVGLLAVCAQMVAYGGFLFTITLHLQQQLGHSPLQAGLTLGPYAIAFACSSLAAPCLPSRRFFPPNVVEPNGSTDEP